MFHTYGALCSPLEEQHQHSLVAHYSPYDDCLGHYEHYAHPPAPPSSSSSELSQALVETPPPESQPIDQVHCCPSTGVPHGGRLHYRQHTHDSFRPVTDPAAYRIRPLAKVCTLPASLPLSFVLTSQVLQRPPSLAIPGSLAYSPSAPMHTLLSSSFSSSDVGTPTPSITLVDAGTGSLLQAPAPALLAPNPKAGQGVLKLPSTKRCARRKPVLACLFCRERKIACGAPPVGSADPTCK